MTLAPVTHNNWTMIVYYSLLCHFPSNWVPEFTCRGLSLCQTGGQVNSFSPSANKSERVSFRGIVLLLCCYPTLCLSLMEMSEIALDLWKAIRLLFLLLLLYCTCQQALRIIDMIPRERSGINISMKCRSATQNDQIFSKFSWRWFTSFNKWQPLIIHKVPGNISPVRYLDSRVRVLDTSGLSCNSALIKRQLMWGVRTVTGEWIILFNYESLWTPTVKPDVPRSQGP